MKKKLHKMVKTGYGLGLLGLAKAKTIVSQIKKDLHLSDKESLSLAKELVSSSEKVTKDVLKTVDKHFSEALIKSKLVNKKELQKAKKKIKKRLKRKK
jgi:polyhydroxyalkanoate synthesis regulator phasin